MSAAVHRDEGETSTRMGRPWMYACDADSVTVQWAPCSDDRGSLRYQLAHRESGGAEEAWTSAPKLVASCAAKKALPGGREFEFRVRARDSVDYITDWSAPSEPVYCPTAEEACMICPAPEVVSTTRDSATLQWSPGVRNASMYRLSIAVAGGGAPEWTEVSSTLGGTTVRKKNLDEGQSYIFRVQAQVDGRWAPPSPPSAAVAPRDPPPVSDAVLRLVGPSLAMPDGGATSTAAALGGDGPGGVIALYFSAKWCPPCKKFTPLLASAYTNLRRKGLRVGVVLCSLDRTPEDFRAYFGGMPFHAVPFDSPHREELPEKYNVQGIPRLVLLDTQGKVIQENAVGPNVEALLAAACR